MEEAVLGKDDVVVLWREPSGVHKGGSRSVETGGRGTFRTRPEGLGYWASLCALGR